jgi:hypothetical protein
MARVDGNRLIRQIMEPTIIDPDRDPEHQATFVTKQPPDMPSLVPLVYARKISGTQLHPKFGEFATFQVDYYAAGLDGYDVAHDLAKLGDTLLYDAWDHQTVYEDGHVSSFEAAVTPFDFPDSAMPDGITRITAEYRLGLRPPPSAFA